MPSWGPHVREEVAQRSRPSGTILGPEGPQGGVGRGGLGWDRASCRSRVSGLGVLACLTTRLNNLTVQFQGRPDY